jgi:hypothetical protein
MIIDIGGLQSRAKVSRSGPPQHILNALHAGLVPDLRQSCATCRLSNLEQGHSITIFLHRNSVLSVLPNTPHTVLSPCPPRLPTRATCSISIISSSSRLIPNSWLRISIVKVGVHRPVMHSRQLIENIRSTQQQVARAGPSPGPLSRRLRGSPVRRPYSGGAGSVRAGTLARVASRPTGRCCGGPGKASQMYVDEVTVQRFLAEHGPLAQPRAKVTAKHRAPGWESGSEVVPEIETSMSASPEKPNQPGLGKRQRETSEKEAAIAASPPKENDGKGKLADEGLEASVVQSENKRRKV